MTTRLAVSPYARRLARERGIALDRLGGSGPRGRIVAADLRTFSPARSSPEQRDEEGHAARAMPASPPLPASPAASAPPPVAPGSAAPSPAPTRTVAALAMTADLAGLRTLREALGEAGNAVALEDLCLKALARAWDSSGSIGWIGGEAGRPAEVAVLGADRLSLSAIGAARREGPATETPAPVALAWIAREGVRPVGAVLPAAAAARVVVGRTRGAAELLLVYDPARLPDREAADLLGALTDALERPLGLLV